MTLFVFFSFFCLHQSETTLPKDRITCWQEDLDYVCEQIKKNHPQPFGRISKEQFQDVFESAKKAISRSRSDMECYLAILRVIASLRDGHSNLGLRGTFDVLQGRFPFRVESFSEGLFITYLPRSKKQFLGSRLISIDNHSIEEVYNAYLEVTAMDTGTGKAYRAPRRMHWSSFLQGLGFLSDPNRIQLLVEIADGSQHHLTLSAFQKDTTDYVGISDLLASRVPDHLRFLTNNEKKVWFKGFEDPQALFLQINQMSNRGLNTPLEVVFESFFEYWDRSNPGSTHLIIDIRHNYGGYSELTLPLIKGILERQSRLEDGGIYVLVGKTTFSAAVTLATQLKRYTDAVFIGEKPGCSSTFFSDSVEVGKLPNHKFPLNISSRHISNAWLDDVEGFPVDMEIERSAQAFFHGRDLLVEKAFTEIRCRQTARKMMNRLAKNHKFNGAVLVSKANHITFQAVHGTASLSPPTAIRKRTTFCIGSVSKMFTSMAIMLLQERGALRFEDKLTVHLPSFKGFADDVSILHLLTHTSGMPEWTRFSEFRSSPGNFLDGITNQQIVAFLEERKILDFPPGSTFSYSNSGYVLLSQIIEKVSGRPYHRFMHEEVFRPLDMHYSYSADGESPSYVKRALGLTSNFEIDDFNVATSGAGSIYSNIHDLFKWSQAIRNHELLKSSSFEVALNPFKLTNGEQAVTQSGWIYGFGWLTESEGTKRILWHDGGFNGFGSIFYLDRNKDLCIVILTNMAELTHPYEILEAMKQLFGGS